MRKNNVKYIRLTHSSKPLRSWEWFFFFFYFFFLSLFWKHINTNSWWLTTVMLLLSGAILDSPRRPALSFATLITTGVLNGWLMILLACGYIHVSFQENNNLHTSVLALGRVSMRIKCSVFCPGDGNAALEAAHVESGISCPLSNDAHVLISPVY